MRRLIVLALALVCIFALSACGGGTPTGVTTPTPESCDVSRLVRPNPELPASGGIWEIGYSSLEWSYPISDCQPESYAIRLSAQEDFSGPSLGGATGTPNTRWGPASPLDPATQYFWAVRAFSQGSNGPWSIMSSFVTGPVCDPGSLVPPGMEAPASQSVVNTLNPRFDWFYPDSSCTPEGYHFELYDSADLSSWVMDANNPNSAIPSFQAGVPLSDCTTYYWRVAPIADGIQGPYSMTLSFSVDAAGACTCDASELAEPVPVWPNPYEIVPDVHPVLEWDNSADCDPEGYAVHLSTEHDFSDTSLFGGTGSPGTSWAPGVPLEPATQYWWQVASGVGTDFSSYSPPRSFFTGPECGSLAEVAAPERLAPVDGAEITEASAKLRYTPGDPGCIPDGYLLELQTDPSFGGTNLLAEYGLPGTTVLTDPLADCTVYYWKVAAVQDASYGPFSEAGWFHTNQSGSCPAPPMPGRANRNFHCRSGGDRAFPILHTFEEGDAVLAVGRSQDASYLVVELDSGRTCWAPSAFTELLGDLSALETLVLPPTPTPEPTDTPTPTPIACRIDLTKSQCQAAGGTWTESMVRSPYCACP